MKDLTNQEFMEIYSAYLPYSPMFRSVKGRIARVTIYGPYVDKISPFGNNIGKSISMGQLKGSFKLLLRPLSDLTREIEHKGERFVPIVELAKASYSSNSWTHDKISLASNTVYRLNSAVKFSVNAPGGVLYSFITKLNGEIIQTLNPHLILRKLHEWHFDTDNLIGRGLALNLNDFEK